MAIKREVNELKSFVVEHTAYLAAYGTRRNVFFLFFIGYGLSTQPWLDCKMHFLNKCGIFLDFNILFAIVITKIGNVYRKTNKKSVREGNQACMHRRNSHGSLEQNISIKAVTYVYSHIRINVP